jgi:hypothetical protein
MRSTEDQVKRTIIPLSCARRIPVAQNVQERTKRGGGEKFWQTENGLNLFIMNYGKEGMQVSFLK